MKLNTYFPPGVVEIDKFIYMDREIEYSYDNPRDLAIQYRASLIQTSTCVRIVSTLHPHLKPKTIINWINHFVLDKDCSYRKTGHRAEMDKVYKAIEMQIMTNREFKDGYNPNYDNFILTSNQPLFNIRSRFNKKNPLTKLEKKLLNDIKNHTDFSHKESFYESGFR